MVKIARGVEPDRATGAVAACAAVAGESANAVAAGAALRAVAALAALADLAGAALTASAAVCLIGPKFDSDSRERGGARVCEATALTGTA